MPVTARLSRLFYERLGEEVANELVIGSTPWMQRTAPISGN